MLSQHLLLLKVIVVAEVFPDQHHGNLKVVESRTWRLLILCLRKVTRLFI